MTSQVTDSNIFRISRTNLRHTASEIQSEVAVTNEDKKTPLQVAVLKFFVPEKNRVAHVRWVKEHVGWACPQ